jgi:hypothetical protein
MSNELQLRYEGNNLLAPTDYPSLCTVIDALGAAGMLPTGMTRQVAIGSAIYGMSMGLPLIPSINNIAPIKGRITIWGDAVPALVQASKVYEYMEESYTGTWPGECIAKCTVKRKGSPPSTHTFSTSDAKRAGLFGKPGPWTLYPEDMLRRKARTRAFKAQFADVLNGMAINVGDDDFSESDVPQQSTIDRLNNAANITPTATPIADAEPQETMPPETQPPAQQAKPKHTREELEASFARAMSDQKWHDGKWFKAFDRISKSLGTEYLNKSVDAMRGYIDHANELLSDAEKNESILTDPAINMRQIAMGVDNIMGNSEFSERVEDMIAAMIAQQPTVDEGY